MVDEPFGRKLERQRQAIRDLEAKISYLERDNQALKNVLADEVSVRIGLGAEVAFLRDLLSRTQRSALSLIENFRSFDERTRTGSIARIQEELLRRWKGAEHAYEQAAKERDYLARRLSQLRKEGQGPGD